MAGDSASNILRQPTVVSAPGKVILFGEHSVVYGKRSLAFSLGLRTELTISPAADVVELHLPEIGVEQSWPLTSFKRLWEKLKKESKTNSPNQPRPISEEEWEIFRSFMGMTKAELEKSELSLISFLHLYTQILPKPLPFSIKVQSQMPVGAGLGSSAAYGVCLAATLMWISGQLNTHNNSVPDRSTLSRKYLDAVCEWAFSSEKILHGTPSGIDNSICTYGGSVSFKAGKIQHLNPPPLMVMLINTNVSRNTMALVEMVREKRNRLSAVMEPLFTSMDNIAESALQILNEMKTNSMSIQALTLKFSQLYELIDLNQCLLSALGVSHPSLDELVATGKKYDLHAKLTGAGGGGFGFVLLPPNALQKTVESCKKDLEAKGFQVWVTELGGEGLKFNSVK